MLRSIPISLYVAFNIFKEKKNNKTKRGKNEGSYGDGDDDNNGMDSCGNGAIGSSGSFLSHSQCSNIC